MTSIQLQECFETIALCVASIYLTICVCLAFFKTPKDELYRPYRQSKRMLTASFAAMATNLIVWRILTTGNWSHFNYGIAILDIVLFYVEELLLCYSFCHILNNSFLTKRRITKDMTQLGIATLLILMPLIPALRPWTHTFFVAALVVMMLTVIGINTRIIAAKGAELIALEKQKAELVEESRALAERIEAETSDETIERWAVENGWIK